MSNKTEPSLFMQCRQALLHAVQAQYGPIETLRSQIHSTNSQTLQLITEWLEEQSNALLRPIVSGHQYDSLFLERIKQTVIEELYSERLHPALNIMPTPVAAPVCDTVHCLLFDQLPNAYNELFPLMLDSYISDLERYGESRRLVIAVHVDWLDDDHITRGAFYSDQNDELVEAPLECVLQFDSIHYLCISPRRHEAASKRINEQIYEVTPYPLASIMDDKYECCIRWMGRGVYTPRATLILQKKCSDEEINNALKYLWEGETPDNALVVAQPNKGTEGRGVKAFRLPKDQDDLYGHVKYIAENDDVLMRCGVEGAYLVHNETKEKTLFDIRVNVVCGFPESGYIQAAAKNAVIASPSQGGRIVEWSSLGSYCVEGGGSRQTLDPDLLRTVQFAANHAVKTFGDGLTAGVDIRLSPAHDKPGFIAWVLDVNPRPAGLGRSCFWNGEPGVTSQLWLQLPSLG